MCSSDLRHAATIVREDTPGDRRIVAYVEPHEVGSFRVADLEHHARARLATHMVPSVFVALDRLPLSEHGKVDRAALPPPTPSTAATIPSARTDLDRLVTDAWRTVLHTEAVGPEQNFFDIGGHSLLLVELQHRLRASTGKDVDLLDLFQYPTVRAQAELLAGSTATAASRTGPNGAAQKALWRRRQQRQAKRGGHD